MGDDTLRDQVLAQQIIGVYDALSARIADRYGFDWLHVGGYNISGSQHAMPDVGLLTLTENLDAPAVRSWSMGTTDMATT